MPQYDRGENMEQLSLFTICQFLRGRDRLDSGRKTAEAKEEEEREEEPWTEKYK